MTKEQMLANSQDWRKEVVKRMVKRWSEPGSWAKLIEEYERTKAAQLRAAAEKGE